MPVEAEEVVARTRAMASDVTVRARRGHSAPGRADVLGSPAPELPREGADAAVERAVAVFHEVERTCTRFDPTSPLQRANASPGRWHVVPGPLFDAIAEAQSAHCRTAGRFDPRVLGTLLELGYDQSLQFGGGAALVQRAIAPARHSAPGPWRPRLRHAGRAVHLGGAAVDLGGIGKGLAVRWASRRIARAAGDYLVEAGGDCYCAGSAPDGGPWHVGVEDPGGGVAPVAVLALRDRAAATSSLRLRTWRVGSERAHHLIDPATGRPGGEGLVAVTVVGDDPATAEVWSKVLFLAGARAIASAAERRGLAALWISDDGALGTSAAMGRRLVWRAR